MSQDHRAARAVVRGEIRQLASSGLDYLVDSSFAAVQGKRVAALASAASCDRNLVSIAEHLSRAPGAQLIRLYAAEHGYTASEPAGGRVVTARHQLPDGRAVPVESIYPLNDERAGALFDNVDIVVIDMPDIGSRYFTYLGTAHALAQRAAAAGIDVLVLDRPNPLGGAQIEGFVAHPFGGSIGLELPARHGLTLGEALRWAGSVNGTAERIAVAPAVGWDRRHTAGDAASLWIAPSPNLPTYEAALVYPGTCLFEGAPCSEGRGTPRPFQYLGHPQIDERRWLRELERCEVELSGAIARPARFKPGSARFAGVECCGIDLHVANEAAFRPVRWGLALLFALRSSHPTLFDEEWAALNLAAHLNRLIGRDFDALYAGGLAAAIDLMRVDESVFAELRRGQLMYPEG